MTQVLIDRATLEQLVESLEEVSDYINRYAVPAHQLELDPIDEAITAGRAALANAEPAGWQPIETAPKDGRPILLFGDCRVTSGNWSAPSETPRIIYQDGFAPDTEWDEWEPYWESWDGGFTEEHPPTHWMPLPAAPKDTP